MDGIKIGSIVFTLTLLMTSRSDGQGFDNCEPQDCVFGLWSTWAPCTLPCGESTRVRYVEQKASCGGVRCSGPSHDSRPCSRQQCSGNGKFTDGGACVCTSGFTGTCCESVIVTSPTASTRDEEPCKVLECLNGGACVRTNQEETCRCLPFYEGDLCQLDMRPRIHSISPTYGPASGGTQLNLHGERLTSFRSINITLEGQPCIIESRTNHVIVCLSPSLNLTEDESRNIPVNITAFPDPVIPGDVLQFNYRQDPVITKVSPLIMPLSGGTMLTVSGLNLNSVANPVLITTLMSENLTFFGDCSGASRDVMLCKTPPVKYNVSGSHLQQIYSSVTPDGAVLVLAMGFILDGVDTYRTLNATLFGALSVFVDPELFKFEENGHVKVFRLYRETSITIKGNFLNAGVSANDYRIHIGQTGSCHVTSLSRDKLTCDPPLVPSAREDTRFEVTVTVGNLLTTVGQLQYERTLWDNIFFKVGVLSAGSLLVLLFIIIIGVTCVRRRRRRNKKKEETLTSSTRVDHIIKNQIPVKPDREVWTQDLYMRLQKHLRDTEQLKIRHDHVIGSGQFGKVYHGSLVHDDEATEVAVKTILNADADPKETKEFIEEALLMADFDHPNVLKLLGIVIDDTGPKVILPYMDNGDLHAYIKEPNHNLTVYQLLHFGLQVAKGMTYLSGQRFVHRDLAARNCMVSWDLVIKISDFGLSRDVYQRDYYRCKDNMRPLPVKWMALESLLEGKYSNKSDVWSFGVLLWELMTRGSMPYPDIANFQMRDYLLEGHRLTRPSHCPTDIYQVMLSCWSVDVEDRPEFIELQDVIERVLRRCITWPHLVQ